MEDESGTVTLTTAELKALIAEAAKEAADEAASKAVAEAIELTRAELELLREEALENADRAAQEAEQRARELIETSPLVEFTPPASMKVTVQGYSHQFVAGQTEKVRQVFVYHFWANTAAQAEADRIKSALAEQYRQRLREIGG